LLPYYSSFIVLIEREIRKRKMAIIIASTSIIKKRIANGRHAVSTKGYYS
jgi:hypothetical protein